MSRALILAAEAGLLLSACVESRGPTDPRSLVPPEFTEVTAERPHIHMMLARGFSPAVTSAGGHVTYHGGPIIQATKVAAIYWASGTIYNGGPVPGTSDIGAQDGSLVGFFLRNLGGSPYFRINTTYYDATA